MNEDYTAARMPLTVTERCLAVMLMVVGMQVEAAMPGSNVVIRMPPAVNERSVTAETVYFRLVEGKALKFDARPVVEDATGKVVATLSQDGIVTMRSSMTKDEMIVLLLKTWAGIHIDASDRLRILQKREDALIEKMLKGVKPKRPRQETNESSTRTEG